MAASRFVAPAMMAVGFLIAAGMTAEAGVMPATSYWADALLDMTDGSTTGLYTESTSLTAGNAQPWYLSPVVERLYGGIPTQQQRDDFRAQVIVRAEETFAKSGLSLDLTANPNDPMPHALSVVSGTYAPSNPDAVGIATLGGSGFTFIDKLSYANSIDQLQWAVAHNVAHELMHAFGVEHHDTTGQYLDAAVTDWNTLINPNATFSPAAVADLASRNFRAYSYGVDYGGYLSGWGHEMVHAPDTSGVTFAAVPEPATMGLWGIGAFSIVLARRTRGRRAA